MLLLNFEPPDFCESWEPIEEMAYFTLLGTYSKTV